jgi:hypothetical protein
LLQLTKKENNDIKERALKIENITNNKLKIKCEKLQTLNNINNIDIDTNINDEINESQQSIKSLTNNLSKKEKKKIKNY